MGRKATQKCIEVVRLSHDRQLASMVLEHVVGLDDGEDKDHQYIFQLRLALGQYEEASRSSMEMAKLEQARNRGSMRECVSSVCCHY